MLNIDDHRWNKSETTPVYNCDSLSIRGEDTEWAVIAYPHDYGFEITLPITMNLANEFVKAYIGERVWNLIGNYGCIQRLPDGLGSLYWSGVERGMSNKYAFVVRRRGLHNEIVGVYRHDFKFWMLHKEVNR